MDYVAREKLKWHSRRSILELDICFDKFIQGGGLDSLGEDELLAYQSLLECDDSDLMVLLLGNDLVKDETAQKVVDKIRIAAKVF
jgi:succinate dehydrogenase flavin-adding protein (antitoxin of CptAB toxin-antitoxin module)